MCDVGSSIKQDLSAEIVARYGRKVHLNPSSEVSDFGRTARFDAREDQTAEICSCAQLFWNKPSPRTRPTVKLLAGRQQKLKIRGSYCPSRPTHGRPDITLFVK